MLAFTGGNCRGECDTCTCKCVFLRSGGLSGFLDKVPFLDSAVEYFDQAKQTAEKITVGNLQKLAGHGEISLGKHAKIKTLQEGKRKLEKKTGGIEKQISDGADLARNGPSSQVKH